MSHQAVWTRFAPPSPPVDLRRSFQEEPTEGRPGPGTALFLLRPAVGWPGMNWRRILSWLWVFLGGWAMVWYWRPHLPPWWAFLLLCLGCVPPFIPELVRDA